MAFGYDAPTNWPEEEKDEFVNITISVFFDGTNNNKYNTEARLEYKNKVDGKPFDHVKAGYYEASADIKENKDSYSNDFSNVARLYKYYEENDSDLTDLRGSIYVEGIGTETYEEDHVIRGAAFGAGSTGILAKVEEGIEESITLIEKLVKNKKIIKNLTFDVFGFSRGAAAARNFIWEITKEGCPAYTSNHHMSYNVKMPAIPDHGPIGLFLEKKDILLDNFRVRFVGLFDTVSSYLLIKSLDINELHLDAVKKADHVLHLTAEDEHRVNFPLIKLGCAGGRKKEFELPGVHSDIGGGYNDNRSEKVTILMDNGPVEKFMKERDRLYWDGWYRHDENLIPIKELDPVQKFWQSAWYGNCKKYELKLFRENVSNNYSFIPLQIMCDYAMENYIRMKFKKTDLQDDFQIPEDLLKIKDILHDYVFNEGRKIKNCSIDELNYRIKLAKGLKEGFNFKPDEPVQDNLNSVLYERDNRHLYGERSDKKEENKKEQISYDPKDYPDNPDVKQALEDFHLLRKIRYKYLHWSANFKEVGMAPRRVNGKRKRQYYPKS